jgi:tetratricopeptide (TPR) repeat protein
MDDPRIPELLEHLKHADAAVRQQATQTLWQIWFQQKGYYGLHKLERCQMLLEAGALQAAEAMLTEIVTDLPDFAEAWNRRAVLYYLQGNYKQAIADCQQALSLNPIHFGALHGMGLCHMALEEYPLAIQAFRQALEIQPYALENQRMILECMASLS